MAGHMLRALNPLAGLSFTISPTLASCDAVPKEAMASGNIGIQASTTITSLTVYTSHDGTNWGKLLDTSGNQVTVTVSGNASEMVFPEIPDICYKCSMLKFKSQAGASDEDVSVYLTS